MVKRIVGCLAAAALAAAPVRAQPAVPQVVRDVYLISRPTGNMLVLVGRDGPVILGAQTPELVAAARSLLASLGARPRYVLVAADDSAVANRDGGWGKDGAITVAHELIRNKIRRLARTDTTILPQMPVLGYSQVFQIAADADEIHLVHHPAGSSDADVIAHFEVREFLYMGALFTSDGYPSIRVGAGGSIAGLIRSANEFVNEYERFKTLIEPIIPGRGPVATWADLRAYRDMLVAVRDRVEPMVRAGKSAAEVTAARPTAEFDARWGRGPVTPAAFVASVYESLKKDTAAAPATPAAPAAAPAAPAAQYPAGQQQHQHGPRPQPQHQHGPPARPQP